MNRPHVICHMISTIDGMVKGDFIYREDLAFVNEAYGDIMMKYAPDATLMGRVTIQEMMGDAVPNLSAYKGRKMERTDYVAKRSTNYVAILDPKGKIAWNEADMDGSHLISVLSNKVSDEYLAYLQELGISYIFAGDLELNADVILEKLQNIFGVKKVMIAGGPRINGTFAEAGLIDELSIIVAPVVTNAKEKATIFSSDSLEMLDYRVENVEKLPDNVLWLNYRRV
ncbi:hypothetical protein lbkm_3588 [Lachnospiraceae bacterium KM106-2]|nr:hypothetical protein lbkm_3588 [Lachnospiraceae bacterium KM106-2]